MTEQENSRNLKKFSRREVLYGLATLPVIGAIGYGLLKKQSHYKELSRNLMEGLTTFVAHANRVGYEDGLNFWGGSTLFDPDGEMVVQGPYHQEALTLAEIDLHQLHRTRTRLPLLRDERTALIMREMNRITARNSPGPEISPSYRAEPVTGK